MKTISITGYGSISALGDNERDVWVSYLDRGHLLTEFSEVKVKGLVSELCATLNDELDKLRKSNLKYHSLDRSVLMAIYVSRSAVESAHWKNNDVFGINIGSSRGATELFEGFYKEFLDDELGKTHPLTSPTTTLGNLSTWVADDLQTNGPVISHSITCSTGLHAVLNGVAWINSGMSEKFLVGATEAPNTDFTIAQMQAIKIYAENKGNYPCRALDFDKKRNTMCLGEGAAVFCLEAGKKDNALAYIESVGFATEKLKHNISITEDAICFQDSMKMALKDVSGDIDVIVMHAPGTIKGDSSEFNAISKVFKNKMPAITSNKWKIGHTLGSSGCFSMELALLMLKHNTFVGIPYLPNLKKPNKISRVLINAVGFGGNAVSIVLKRK
ncbi:beta-ketoacyl synthase N-terminal-like domain-containing protein [Wenyingzhuangia sp. IMCC45533]